MHFKEYRRITIHLYNVLSLSIESPYFIKDTAKKHKKGKRCKKRQGVGAQVGLEGVFQMRWDFSKYDHSFQCSGDCERILSQSYSAALYTCQKLQCLYQGS